MTDFNTWKYERVHGKKPNGGYGMWAFQFGKHTEDDPLFQTGKLTETKKAVKAIAKAEGFSGTIYILG